MSTKRFTLHGERLTIEQYDAEILRVAARVGADGFEFEPWQVARWLYRSPTGYVFGVIRDALLRLAKAGTKFGGRRIVWYDDDGRDQFYMLKRGKRARIDMAALDARILKVRQS